MKEVKILSGDYWEREKLEKEGYVLDQVIAKKREYVEYEYVYIKEVKP